MAGRRRTGERPETRVRRKPRKSTSPRRKKAAKRSAKPPATRGAAVAAALDRAAVRAEVVGKIAKVVKRSAASLRDEDRLFEDLGMGAPLRSSMAKTYTDIARSHGGLPVTIDDAGKLKTVGEAVDLVFRRSQGKP